MKLLKGRVEGVNGAIIIQSKKIKEMIIKRTNWETGFFLPHETRSTLFNLIRTVDLFHIHMFVCCYEDCDEFLSSFLSHSFKNTQEVDIYYTSVIFMCNDMLKIYQR